MTPLTLEQAKDLIAQKYGKTTWHSLGYEFSEPYGREIPSKYFDEAAELYCQSHKARAWEEGADAQFKDSWNFERDHLNPRPKNPYIKP